MTVIFNDGQVKEWMKSSLYSEPFSIIKEDAVYKLIDLLDKFKITDEMPL